MISISLKLLAISIICKYKRELHERLVTRQVWDQIYDYIVVGAGSAGCVVAARLSEDANKTVLLLEAGGPQTLDTDMPAKHTIGSEVDWKYPIVSQRNAYLGLIGNRKNIARGRVFGGSSAINSMHYYRESPEYYELWDKLYGIKNWTFDDVLPFFLKSENNLDQLLLRRKTEFHRTGGPLSVSTAIPDKMLERYVRASEMLGYKTINDDTDYGITIMQRTIKDGVRQSSATAFLEPNLKENLHIIGYTLVRKILFNDKKRAIGVEFERNGSIYTVKAQKEIILSAGVIGSPQLLMLSGIGSKKHLQDLNITVISDLKVGDNLQNIATMTMNFDIKNQSEIPKPISDTDNLFDFYTKHNGPLAYAASGMHCFSQIKLKNASNGCNLPRISFIGSDLDKICSTYKLKDECKKYFRPYLNRSAFLMMSLIRRQKTSGTVRLATDNPRDYPIIDPCLLCDETDVDALVETTKLSLTVYLSPYFQQFAEIYKNPIPGCNPCPDYYFCDSYLRCVAKTNTYYIVPVGACRMGTVKDPNAVVDEKFKVKGVSGLRVVDCSVLPLSSDQTNAITIMLGERGAHFIKRDSV